MAPKIKKWATENKIHFWDMFLLKKSQTGPRIISMRFWEVGFLPKQVRKWATKNIHFWEISFTSKNNPQKRQQKLYYTLLGNVFSQKNKKKWTTKILYASGKSVS